MTDSEITAAVTTYEFELGIPVTDAIARPTSRLLDMVLAALPELGRDVTAAVV